MSLYIGYLRAYSDACRTRPREPGIVARTLDFVFPGRERRAAVRAIGMADGLMEKPLRSKAELQAEVARMLDD